VHAREALEEAARRWENFQPGNDAVLETMCWLRAARAAWMLGDRALAQTWYGRVPHGILDVAFGFGESTGTYAYYAELAVGAAVLSDDASLISRVADAVRDTPPPPPTRRPKGRWVTNVEPLGAAHEVLRAWAAWCVGDVREATLAVMAAGRLTASFSLHTETRWRRSHWPDLLAAVEALVDASADRLRRAIEGLDRKLVGGDESLGGYETAAALAVEWRRRYPRTYSSDGFVVPIEPGTSASLPLHDADERRDEATPDAAL